MEFKQLVAQGIKVQKAYAMKNEADGYNQWTAAEYMQGYVGDVGDLAKLIMAKNNFRHKEKVDEKIAHELADCLWSIIVLADQLNIDLEREFLKTMNELDARIKAV